MKWDDYKDLFDGEDEDVIAVTKSRVIASKILERDAEKNKASQEKDKKQGKRRFLLAV